MNEEFKEWFVVERAKALTMVFLTRRDDLIVKEEMKKDNGLDYTVYIKTVGDVGVRAFGIELKRSLAPVSLQEANRLLAPGLTELQSLGPFHIPVCMFYFTVKEDQGYYTWVCEPIVSSGGQPRLSIPTEPHGHPLTNESLEEIVTLVNRWYDAFYSTITYKGKRVVVEEKT